MAHVGRPLLAREQRLGAGWVDTPQFARVHRNFRSFAQPDREPFELGISELLEDLTAWAEAGDIPSADFEYLAIAGVGMGFQVATHLVDGDPPDIEGATRFCTRMFMGGLKALSED